MGTGAALGLAQVVFFTAADMGNLGLVSVLGALSPRVPALLARVFLGERLTGWQSTALAIVLVGLCLVVS